MKYRLKRRWYRKDDTYQEPADLVECLNSYIVPAKDSSDIAGWDKHFVETNTEFFEKVEETNWKERFNNEFIFKDGINDEWVYDMSIVYHARNFLFHFIEQLLKEQEEKHKKEIEDAIRKGCNIGNNYTTRYQMAEIDKALKKFNLEGESK